MAIGGSFELTTFERICFCDSQTLAGTLIDKSRRVPDFCQRQKKRKSSDGSKKVSKKLKSSESSSVKIFGFEKVSAAGSKYFKTWCDLHGAFHLVEQKLLRMLVQTV